LQAGGNTRGAGLKAGRDTKKVAALKNQAEKSADPFDVMLAAHLGQYAEGNERNTRSLSFPAGAYSQ
jgi:hypothetical protein